MKVVLDAGHGINTAGKRTPDGIREWTLNETVLRGFENTIKEYQGVKTLRVDDPTGKRDVPLRERTNKSNNWGADYYISFHHNAYQSKWGNHGGSEVWVQDNRSRELATVMLNAIVGTLGLRNRGVKIGNYHVNRETRAISCLVEVGFMDSNTDKVIRDKGKRYEVGVNMAHAFAKQYRLKLKGAPKPQGLKVGDTVTYDGHLYRNSAGGGRGTKVSGTFKVTILNDNSHGVHLDNKGWVRAEDVNGTVKPKEKTASQMADEVIAGLHGNGHENRRKSLGVTPEVYARVTLEVNNKLGTGKKSVVEMAKEVIAGKHGNGHANRQKSLGISNAEYQKVRQEVNKLV